MNWTRLVSSRRAAARARTSSVLATPGTPSMQHVAAAQQGDDQPGDGRVLPDDGLGDLRADGAEGGAGHVRRVHRCGGHGFGGDRFGGDRFGGDGFGGDGFGGDRFGGDGFGGDGFGGDRFGDGSAATVRRPVRRPVRPVPGR